MKLSMKPTTAGPCLGSLPTPPRSSEMPIINPAENVNIVQSISEAPSLRQCPADRMAFGDVDIADAVEV